jgi:hypothetical protein
MPGSPSEPYCPSSVATDNGLIEGKPLDLLSGPGGREVHDGRWYGGRCSSDLLCPNLALPGQ